MTFGTSFARALTLSWRSIVPVSQVSQLMLGLFSCSHANAMGAFPSSMSVPYLSTSFSFCMPHNTRLPSIVVYTFTSQNREKWKEKTCAGQMFDEMLKEICAPRETKKWCFTHASGTTKQELKYLCKLFAHLVAKYYNLPLMHMTKQQILFQNGKPVVRRNSSQNFRSSHSHDLALAPYNSEMWA